MNKFTSGSVSVKIGILTFHRAKNFGANLQAYALNEYICKQNYNCEIVDFYPNNYGKQPVKIIRKILSKIKRLFIICKYRDIIKFNNFQSRNYILSPKKYYGDEDIMTNSPEYDILISGSDQIFNTTLTGNSKSFYLCFNNKAKKISYASSFGRTELSNEEYALINSELPKFSAISVREKSAGDIIEKETGKNSKLVLDPVLLLDSSEWNFKTSKKQRNKNYIFVYVMEVTENLQRTVSAMAGKNNLPVYVLYGCSQHSGIDGVTIKNIGPEEFLGYLRSASLVITNSFHGTAFSIIFKKRFVSVSHSTRNARLKNLMTLIGEKDKLVSDNTDVFEAVVDGNTALSNITPYINASKEYLLDALKI